MRIVIIHDSRRPEKKELFIQELFRQGIEEFEIFPCIVLTNSVVESISESFKTIIRQSKENDEECVCIMENDVYFPNEKGWEYFLENKPEKYSVYVSGNYLIDNRLEYKPPLVKIQEWVGNQLIIVDKSYYDIWLNTNSKKHCDTVHSGLGEFYLCFPMVALQRSGYSANNNAVVNYNPTIPSEYIYK